VVRDQVESENLIVVSQDFSEVGGIDVAIAGEVALGPAHAGLVVVPQHDCKVGRVDVAVEVGVPVLGPQDVADQGVQVLPVGFLAAVVIEVEAAVVALGVDRLKQAVDVGGLDLAVAVEVAVV